MLRAVPIEPYYVDHESPLSFGVVSRHHQRCDLFRIIGGIGVADHFEPTPGGVIHQEQAYAIIGSQVRGREVLAVSTIVGKTDAVPGDLTQNSCRPAAMLHIGPAIFTHAGQIEAVSRGDEIKLSMGESVHLAGMGFHSSIGRPRAVNFLQSARLWAEHCLEECLCHRTWASLAVLGSALDRRELLVMTTARPIRMGKARPSERPTASVGLGAAVWPHALFFEQTAQHPRGLFVNVEPPG